MLRIQYKAVLTSASHTIDQSDEWNKPAMELHADGVVLYCNKTCYADIHNIICGKINN